MVHSLVPELFNSPKKKGAFQIWIMYSCTHVVGEVRQFQDEFTTLFCHVVPHNSHNFCHQYKVQLLISSLAWYSISSPHALRNWVRILPGFEGTKTSERVFLHMRLCLNDFSSSNDLFSNDSIISCTAHNGLPPPWRFGILKKGPTSANFLVITCKKKWAISPYTTASYCWLMWTHLAYQMETNNYFE